jgi:hypothetical protein
MPFTGNDFQYDRGEAYAELTSGRYGEEHDQRMAEGVDLENGVRKYWADRLRKFAEDADPEVRKHVAAYFDLLDPYSGRDGDNGQFARTTLDDRPEGAKWITPNNED